MKIRKEYSIVILDFRGLAVLTKKTNSWTSWAQTFSCGSTVIDCSFNQAVQNLKILSKKGYYVYSRKKGRYSF